MPILVKVTYQEMPLWALSKRAVRNGTDEHTKTELFNPAGLNTTLSSAVVSGLNVISWGDLVEEAIAIAAIWYYRHNKK